MLDTRETYHIFSPEGTGYTGKFVKYHHIGDIGFWEFVEEGSHKTVFINIRHVLSVRVV